MGQKEFDKKEETAKLMVQIPKPPRVTGKVLVVDIVFCVMERRILMVEKGVFGLVLINK